MCLTDIKQTFTLWYSIDSWVSSRILSTSSIDMICPKQEKEAHITEEKGFGWKVFSTHSGWLVNCLSKIRTLYPRMCSSHTAVVKALLLNPLIFKQCAPAMLTQTTRLLRCSILTQGSHSIKYAYYQWKLTLLKYTFTYLNLKGELLSWMWKVYF